MATIENFILRFKVEGQKAINDAKAGVASLAKSMEGLNLSGGSMGDTITGLLGKLGPLGVAAGVAGGAFVAMGLKAINLADSLADLSNATGISASELSSLKGSIILSGGSADDMEKIVTKLHQSINEAAGGSDQLGKAFQALGVYTLDANGKMRSGSDVLQDLLKKFQAGELSGKQYAAAVDILGKTINHLELGGLKAVNDPFKDEQIKQLAKYKDALDNVANSASNKLLTVFGKLAIAIEDNMAKLDRLEKKANEQGRTVPFKKLGGAIELPENGKTFEMSKKQLAEREAQRQIENMKEIDAEVEKERKRLGEKKPAAGAYRGVSEAEIKAAAEAAKRIAQIKAEIEKNGQMSMYDDIKNITVTKEAEIAKAKEEIYARENVSKKQMDEEYLAKKKELEAKAAYDIAKLQADVAYQLRDQLLNLTRSTEEKKAAFQLEKDSLGLSTEQLSKAQKILEVENARKKSIDEAAKIKNVDLADFQKQVEAINALAAEQKQIIEQQYEYQRSFEKGWSDAYAAFIENGTNAAKIAGDMFNSMTSNINSAIDNFVETGKFSFKDFASSVIKDLMKIQLKAATVGLFKSIGLGDLFGLPAGKAIGGPVSGNTPYIVGEKGPELFIPSSGGSIVPNNKMGNGGGMGSTTIVNNISAIDAKSVAQLFAENRMTLFGNVEQARRELPMRTR